MIFDSHSDIFYNLEKRYAKGCDDPFKQYHQNDLLLGDIKGGIWVVYSERDFDIIKVYKKALELYEPYKKEYDVIYGLEGLRNVLDLKMLKELYDMGIRHASLTWNEENHLATGVKGSSTRGLTELGKTFISFMNEHHMIVDVSHLNVQSFYDVLAEKPKILIASHSNAYTLSNHQRNLTDEQLQALKEAGGYIGIVAARNFVSRDPEKQNIQGLIDQLEYILNIMGEDRVMLGLDMMNYLDDFDNSNLDDLKSHRDVPNLIKAMKNRGIKQEIIDKVTYKNFLELKKKIKGE